MLRSSRSLVALVSTAAYAAWSVVITWPLARNLTTSLPGDPTGDTGVYVWNLWVFRHELVRHGRLPFSTDHIFAFTGGADFSLHNYTPLAGLAGTVLIPAVGVVGAFNLVMLAFLTLSAMGVFLLARELGLRRTTAWVAGALFVASPVITARETAHLSLVSTAPLPLFLWVLLRTLNRPRTWHGVALGALVACATYADAYFGIYCVLMGTFVLACRFLRVERSPVAPAATWRARRYLDVACALLLTGIGWRLVSGTTVVFVGPVRVGLVEYYTPMLVLVALAALRAWLTWPLSVRLNRDARNIRSLVVPGLTSVLVCLALLLPLLIGLTLRYLNGRLPATATYWRSSPRGVDLLAYLVPNPTHPVVGQITERWLLPERADAFPEFVAAFPLFALAVIAFAIWRGVVPRMWVAFTAFFVLLSLGPFVHVAGINTYIVGPWAFLRYVPIVGMARSPSRFAIVAALGLSLLFAFAMQSWLASRAGRRSPGVFAVGLLVLLEVLPAPRTLHSASVPDIYRLVFASASDEDGRLMELPNGVRDGTSSLGDFNASTAFFQTSHRRPLIGGYLSRVSEWRRRQSRRAPILRGIYALSEGGALPPGLADKARESRDSFLRRSCLKYVIVDKNRASEALRDFATAAIGLVPLHEDDRYHLLTPDDPPPCDPRGRGHAPASAAVR